MGVVRACPQPHPERFLRLNSGTTGMMRQKLVGLTDQPGPSNGAPGSGTTLPPARSSSSARGSPRPPRPSGGGPAQRRRGGLRPPRRALLDLPGDDDRDQPYAQLPGPESGKPAHRVEHQALGQPVADAQEFVPVVCSDCVDMDQITGNYQWTDSSGDTPSGGVWYYLVTAYNASCPAEGPFSSE